MSISNGIEQIRITSGNVGIGTTSPSEKLSVTGNGTLTGSITADSGVYNNVGISIFTFGNIQSQSYIQANNSFKLGAGASVLTNAFPILSINSDSLFTSVRIIGADFLVPTGNVGIGTTTPLNPLQIMPSSGLAQYQLTLGGNGPNIGSNSYYSGGWKYIANGSAAIWSADSTGSGDPSVLVAPSGTAGNAITWVTPFTIYNASAVANTLVLKAGNVGIGTTTPTVPLQIVASDNQYKTFQHLRYTWSGNDIPLYFYIDNNGPWVYTSGNAARYITLSADGTNGTLTVQGNNSVSINSSTAVTGGRLYVNGNVGIGDSSPASLLTVGSGDLFQVNSSGLAFLPLGAVGTPSLSFTSDTNTGLWSSGADTLNFSTGGSERVRIDSSGNVGIGTTSPTKGQLQLAAPNGDTVSAIAIRQSNDSLYGMDFAVSQSTGNGIIYAVSNDVKTSLVQFNRITNVVNFNGGNVGIGTATPGFPLDVVSGVAPYTALRLQGNSSPAVYGGQVTSLYGYLGSGYYYNSGSWRTGNTTATDIRFNNDGSLAITTDSGLTANTNYTPTTRLTIDTSGNVGIGTTSPGTTKLYIADSSADSAIPLRVEVGSAANDNAKTVTLRLAGAGASWYSVGDLVSGHETNGSSPASYMAFTTRAAGGTIAEKMRITSTGNVGIGTTAPSAKLSVVGGFILADPAGGTTNGIKFGALGNQMTLYDDGGGIIYFDTISASNANVPMVFRSKGSSGGFYFVNGDGGGKVGIGTTTPSSLLHLYKASGDSILSLENTGAGNSSGIDFVRQRSSGNGSVGGSIFMDSDTGSNDAVLYLQTQSASAQSGVTSSLSANNGVRLKLSGGGSNTNTQGVFSVESGATETFRITGAGNVGIGMRLLKWANITMPLHQQN